MSIVQSSYAETHDKYQEGQVASLHSCDIDSYESDTSDDIPFGYAVIKSTGDKTCKVGSGAKGAGVLGIAVEDQRLPASNGGVYKKGNIVSVLTQGDIAVKVALAVSAGDAVSAALAAVPGDSAAIGQLSSHAEEASEWGVISGAKFLTGAAAGKIAIVRLNLP